MPVNDKQVGGNHYKKHGALQHWDLVIKFGWDYFQGQIIKYVMRWKDKGGVQDLQKAAHFLEKYIEGAQEQEAIAHNLGEDTPWPVCGPRQPPEPSKTPPGSLQDAHPHGGAGGSLGPFAYVQERIVQWVKSRYGEAVLFNRQERVARLLEEAAELAQAEGLSYDFSERILQRVWTRDVGIPPQEASGVMLTILAWSYTTGVNLLGVCEDELNRIEKVPVEVSRNKHLDKEMAGTAVVKITKHSVI